MRGGPKPHHQVWPLHSAAPGSRQTPGTPNCSPLAAPLPPLFQHRAGGRGGRTGRVFCLAFFFFARGCNGGAAGITPLPMLCYNQIPPARHSCPPRPPAPAAPVQHGGHNHRCPCTAAPREGRGAGVSARGRLPESPPLRTKGETGNITRPPPPRPFAQRWMHTRTHAHTDRRTHGAAGRVTYLQVPVGGRVGWGGCAISPVLHGGDYSDIARGLGRGGCSAPSALFLFPLLPAPCLCLRCPARWYSAPEEAATGSGSCQLPETGAWSGRPQEVCNGTPVHRPAHRARRRPRARAPNRCLAGGSSPAMAGPAAGERLQGGWIGGRSQGLPGGHQRRQKTLWGWRSPCTLRERGQMELLRLHRRG